MSCKYCRCINLDTYIYNYNRDSDIRDCLIPLLAQEEPIQLGLLGQWNFRSLPNVFMSFKGFFRFVGSFSGSSEVPRIAALEVKGILVQATIQKRLTDA